MCAEQTVNGSDRGGLAAAGQRGDGGVAFGGGDGVRGGIENYEHGVGNGLMEAAKDRAPMCCFRKKAAWATALFKEASKKDLPVAETV